MNEKIKHVIHNPKIILTFFLYHGVGRLFPDEKYLKIIYRLTMGKKLNLDNPETYTEKLQWLKLHDRKPEYTQMVDKAEAKNYVAQIIGEEYIIPTFGVWERFEDIDFDTLPNRFVLKCTHDSGDLIICKDKSKLNKEEARRIISHGLRKSYYMQSREWPYKNVRPRIIAEKYMEDSMTKDLRDYKFFTFNGVTRALFVASDRFTKGQETKFDFFDADYNHLPIINGHPNGDMIPEKPKSFNEMKELAQKLSQGIPHLRVDFYEVNGKIYFGELTFSHWSGLMPFEPPEWDKTFGSWITLPRISE